MTSILKVSSIQNNAGTAVIVPGNISSGARYIRQIVSQVDTGLRTAGASMTFMNTFPKLSGFQAGSLIKMSYHVPTRNDSTSWGGGYTEPQVSFDSNSWLSLGTCGHDAGVMHLGNAYIGHYHQSILIDPGINQPFDLQFRFYFSSYDGTINWNNSHDLNNVSGTASILSGDNGNQHFMHMIIEEYARLN